MYKLENNVEWTDELKEAFKHNITRAQLIQDNILLTENSNELLTESGETFGFQILNNESNSLKEIELQDNRYVPDLGFIGQATSKQLTATLFNKNTEQNLENQEFILKIGAEYNGQTYYINYGNFIVNSPPENDDTNDTTKIVAYDYMIKFNKDYIDSVTYPCTLYTLLQNVCRQAGVELGTQEFANYDFVVENNQFEGKKLREVLQNIAKCAFSWARIGQDNKLYLDFKVNNKPNEKITMHEYKQNSFKKANEYYGPINKVTYNETDIEGVEESVEDYVSIKTGQERSLVISNNLFAYNISKRDKLIQQGKRLFGLKYLPIQKIDMIGLAYLDCNDIIDIRDMENKSYISRVFNHTITYNGVLNDSISSEANSINEETYMNANKTNANNIKIDFIVDRAQKQIEGIIEDIQENQQKISIVTQTLNQISQTVENNTNYKRTVTSDSTLITEQDTAPTRVFRFVLNGNREYNNYLRSGETSCSDITFVE